jgi:predicted nucleotidyltransferase
VSGREHARSDVDLAVLLGDPKPSLRMFGELGADLQRLFPERRVDLALINRADPLFLRKITERCRLLYGAPRRLHELRMYAFRRYQDHRKYLALERDYLDRALAAARHR